MTVEAKPIAGGVAKIDKAAAKGRSLWADAFARLLRNRAAVAGLIIIILNLLVATFAPLIAPRDSATQVLEDNNAAPLWVIRMFPVMQAADQTRQGSLPPARRHHRGGLRPDGHARPGPLLAARRGESPSRVVAVVHHPQPAQAVARPLRRGCGRPRRGLRPPARLPRLWPAIATA